MGQYSVPEEIRAMKPRGTMVKKIGGRYYVYTHSQSKDPETGKWKTDPGTCIGQIVEGVGFFPNASKAREQKITCFNYGEYRLACACAIEDLKLLKRCFNPDEAMKLVALACIWAVMGYIGLVAAEGYYERSLIAHDYPALQFSYKTMAKLLEAIATRGLAGKYYRLCSEQASSIAVDGHAITSGSERNSIASPGHKTKSLKSEYLNLMVALDTETGLAVATKVFPGYMLDKTDFLDFIELVGDLKGKLLLMDMVFFSSENTDFIVSHGGHYIIPVASNRKAYGMAVNNAKVGRRSQFLYHTDRRDDTVEFREADGVLPGRRVIWYKNIAEASRLSSAYLKELERGVSKSHTLEKYEKLKDDFGVIVLETDMDAPPAEIYERYKKRWTIETFCDRLANGIDFEELNLDDWAMAQGVAFVMMIAARIDARILDKAKKVKVTRRQLVDLALFLQLTDEGKSAVLHNIKREHYKVFEAIGVSLNPKEKCFAGA